MDNLEGDERDTVSLELSLSYGSGKRSRDSSSSSSSSTPGTLQEQDVFKRRRLIHPVESIYWNTPEEEEEEEEEEEKEEEEKKKLPTELKLYEDTWTIKKVLKASDVNGSSRLLLSTCVAEEHIIKKMEQSHAEKIYSGDGAKIRVCDYDTEMSEYELTLKLWSSGSYVLINNWRKDFVKRRGLKCNDEIAMLWDPFKSVLWFRVLKQGSV